jgi:hypothetical protein
MPTRPTRTTRAACLAAGLLLLPAALVACSDDDEDTGTTSSTEAPATEEGATPVVPDGEPPSTVEVVATDFAFSGLPDSVPAGTKLTLVNDAATELHELVAFRLPDDEERSIDELAALPPEQLEPIFAGEPTAVLLAPPGGPEIAAVGDGTLTEPGRYAVICMIPTGVAPEVYLAAAAESAGGPPQIEDAGPPHLAHGMYAELVVE